jgi:hypothetical protein
VAFQYEINGKLYEFERQPTDEDIDEIAGVQKKPASKEPMGFWRSLPVGVAQGAGALTQAGGQALAGLSGALGINTPESDDAIFKGSADAAAAMERFANPDQRPMNIMGKVGSIPGQLLGLPDIGPRMGRDLIDAGESVDTARTGTLAGTALTAGAMALPASVGTTLATRALTGAGANVAAGVAMDASMRGLSDSPEIRKQYDPMNLEARAIEAGVGALFGVIPGSRGSKIKDKPPEQAVVDNVQKILDQKKTQEAPPPPVEPPAPPRPPAAPIEANRPLAQTQQDLGQLVNRNDVDTSGVRNPYDVAGRVSDERGMMETNPQSPQMGLFDTGARSDAIRQQEFNRSMRGDAEQQRMFGDLPPLLPDGPTATRPLPEIPSDPSTVTPRLDIQEKTPDFFKEGVTRDHTTYGNKTLEWRSTSDEVTNHRSAEVHLKDDTGIPMGRATVDFVDGYIQVKNIFKDEMWEGRPMGPEFYEALAQIGDVKLTNMTTGADATVIGSGKQLQARLKRDGLANDRGIIPAGSRIQYSLHAVGETLKGLEVTEHATQAYKKVLADTIKCAT